MDFDRVERTAYSQCHILYRTIESIHDQVLHANTNFVYHAVPELRFKLESLGIDD